MAHKQTLNDQELQELKAKIAEDDQGAFRRLFDIFFPRLFDFTHAILKTKDAATDVTNQVFIKIWQARHSMNNVENLRVYLYAACKNTALNYLSRKAKEQITEPFDLINIQLKDDANPEQQLITAEIFNKIRLAIDELPPRCKMIFKLVREDGLKYREVAEILNVSENTVDAQMVIAVKKIGEKVKTHFEAGLQRLPIKK